MLKNVLNHKGRIAVTIALIILLVLIRTYENSLFYDPFLSYFKSDYYNLPFPETDNFQLFLGLFFRYLLNTILSLLIIYALFKDIDAIKFTAILYLLFFIVLAAAFFVMLQKGGEVNKMGLFYIRRFIIQPIFLLLFVPAFYYQKKKN